MPAAGRCRPRGPPAGAPAARPGRPRRRVPARCSPPPLLGRSGRLTRARPSILQHPPPTVSPPYRRPDRSPDGRRYGPETGDAVDLSRHTWSTHRPAEEGQMRSRLGVVVLTPLLVLALAACAAKKDSGIPTANAGTTTATP